MHKGKTTMVGCIAAEAPWLKQRTMDPFLGMTNSRNPGWGFWQFPHGCSIYWRKTLENYLDATHVSYLVVCFASRGFKYLRIYVHMSLPSSQMVFPCISIFPDSTFLDRVWLQIILCTDNKGFAQRVAQITNTARVNEDREKHWTHGPWMSFDARSLIPAFLLHGSKKRCQIWSRRCKS